MEVRYAKDEDWPLFASWWKAHGWPVVAKEMLSPQGVVVLDGGRPVIVGWFIKTDTQTALFEWIVKDPELQGKQADEALDLLFEALKFLAKEAGYKIFVTFLEHKGLIKRLVNNHGAVVGDISTSTIVGKL